MNRTRRLSPAIALFLVPACADLFSDPEPSPTYTALDAGGDHSCALDRDGRAYCWGRGENGELGDGRVRNSVEPVAVAGARAFAAISAGEHHTCGVTTDGEALCWGWNQYGQLGTGSTVGLGSPGAVAGGLSFRAISSGATHTCALTPEGAAYCWGDNGYGQLGNGTTDGSTVPVPVAGGLSFEAISSGVGHTCAVAEDGATHCWGLNHVGQLGDGSVDGAWMPRPVAGSLSFVAVSAGAAHTCGVTASGGVYCWGGNSYGELGNTFIEPPRQPGRTVPDRVYGASGASTVAVGPYVTCAVDGERRAHCWGRGFYGQLGNGQAVNAATPQPVVDTPAELAPERLRVRAIDVGGAHACALSLDGDAFCWGSGDLGQLGNASYTFSTVPVRVSNAR